MGFARRRALTRTTSVLRTTVQWAKLRQRLAPIVRRSLVKNASTDSVSKKSARTWASRRASAVVSARMQSLQPPVRSVLSRARLVSAKLAPRRPARIFTTKRASAYHHARLTSPRVHQIAHNVTHSVHDVSRSLVTKRATKNTTGTKRRAAQRKKNKHHRI